MATHSTDLDAEPRTMLGKEVRKLRRRGVVPANIFGHGQSRAIQATAHDLELLLARGGRSGVVTISVAGEKHTVLLKQLNREPKSGRLQHLDFQAVSMTERVHASVPLRFVGESPAVKEFNGVVMHQMTELQVECRVGDLPERIEVDITVLAEVHSTIHVRDLILPERVTADDPGEEIVAVVIPSAPSEAEEPAETTAAADAPLDPAANSAAVEQA